MENYFFYVKIFDWNYLHLTAQTKETYFSNFFPNETLTGCPFFSLTFGMGNIQNIATCHFLYCCKEFTTCRIGTLKVMFLLLHQRVTKNTKVIFIDHNTWQNFCLRLLRFENNCVEFNYKTQKSKTKVLPWVTIILYQTANVGQSFLLLSLFENRIDQAFSSLFELWKQKKIGWHLVFW